jgi:peroxiredoxin
MAPVTPPAALRRRAEALDLLLRHHLESDGLGALFQVLSLCPTDEGDAFLRAVLERGKKGAVRGEACLALGQSRMKRAENVRRIGADPGLAKRFAREYGEEALRRYRGPSPEALDREAEQLFERARADFRGVTSNKTTLGAKAEEALFALRNLRPGNLAPEIEGTDADGKALKLSDYRGKVVVLTFSGNWCGPCRAMYPAERKLVERLKGQPFAALSVNTDPKKETLQEAIRKGEITWRCWWDGAGGPIVKRWNVRSFPAVFVLDRRGVIRHTDLRGEALGAAVEGLLREQAGAPAPTPGPAKERGGQRH